MAPQAANTPSAAEKNSGSGSVSAGASTEKSYFETQREALVNEIALSLEHVLMNLNKLNRSLESVIVVGKEFDAVENLWSQFEGVMAQDPEAERENVAGEPEETEGNDTITQ